jgi:hypothetical protein
MMWIAANLMSQLQSIAERPKVRRDKYCRCSIGLFKVKFALTPCPSRVKQRHQRD